MVLPIPGGGSEESGCCEGQGVNPHETEHSHAIIATRPILGLCEVAERRQGTQFPWRWWEQTGIDWKQTREKAAAQEVENKAEPELTVSESDSDPETTPGVTVGGTREEASLGASSSSGAEWSGLERGGGLTKRAEHKA